MTVSTGVTSCGRRGSGCARTGVQPGWIGSPWLRWRITAWTACCVSCVVTFVRVGIVRRRRVGWRFRNHKVVSGRGDTDGAGPGGPGGGQDRAGTDFRGGFSVVLVWVSAETVGDDGDGTLADRVHRGLPVRGGVRYRQFLRRDRP